MSSLNHTSRMLQEVDFPMTGIETPSWVRVSPGVPLFWRAFALSMSGNCSYYFLGGGYSNLEIPETSIGMISVICVNGYAYAISDLGVRALPSKLRGYTQKIVTEERIVLSNYSELLMIDNAGVFRYAEDLVVDDLELISVDGNQLRLVGCRTHGNEIEEWSVHENEIPIIVVEG